jgi:regulation of enolase protein 1 (concanavalin A-like superfamily)
VIADASLDGEDWQQLRMARLQELGETGPAQIGLYACSPTAGGFLAEFNHVAYAPGRMS